MEPYRRLEREWAVFNELDPAGMVACSSGTAALHLALEALRLPPGSEVIVPDYTMIACARAVTMAGHSQLPVDCDQNLLICQPDYTDYLMGKSKYPNTIRAMMVVHTYGRRVDTEEVAYWVDNREGGCYVIEDLAEAHGVVPHPATDAACWSFYKNKVVAGEEGGAVWFRDPDHAALARRLRTLGFTEEHDYTHVPRGHNYRMSDAHASLVLRSLADYHANLRARRDREAECDRHCPPEWRSGFRDVPWVYDFRVPGLTKDRQRAAVALLRDEGIAARFGFQPVSSQEEYRDPGAEGRNPNAYAAAREVIYLPLDPTQPPGLGERAFRLLTGPGGLFKAGE